MSYSSIRSLSPWRRSSRSGSRDRREEKKSGGLAKNAGEESEGESELEGELRPLRASYRLTLAQALRPPTTPTNPTRIFLQRTRRTSSFLGIPT